MEQGPSSLEDVRAWPRATPLLEREPELAAIGDALAAAERGDGSLIVVEGSAGIGKSRLLAAAAERAEDVGLRVLTAHGGESERDFPFGIALQLFERVLAEAEDRARLLTGPAELAGPLLTANPSGRTLPDDDALFPLLHGLFWLTQNLAAESPLLVQVDDLHWVDDSSLRFLLYLAQRLDGLPVAVTTSTRSGDGEGTAVAHELRDHPGAVVLPLRSLSPAAVSEVVRAAAFPSAEDAFCQACAEASGGNPFLLVELLGALVADGVTPTAEAAGAVGTATPESVARQVLARLRRLPPAAAALARAAAIAGDGGALRHAAVIAELGAEEAPAAADSLAAAEILVPGQPLRFVHPIVRSAIYEEMPAGERGRGHLRIARLLSDEDAPPGRAAAHLLRAERGGERWVVELLVHAAEQALASGVPRTAADYLCRALEEPPEPAGLGELLVLLAQAEASCGAPEAFERFEQALELIDDRRRAAEVLFLLGRRLYVLGRYPDAAHAFERGLERLDGGEPELAAQLEAGYVTAARLDVSLRPAATKRLEALIARPEARSSGMESILVAQVAFERMVTPAGRREVISLARRALADDTLLAGGKGEGLAYYSAVAALGYADELADARNALDRAVEVARERGSVVGFARALLFRAFVLYRAGHVTEAMNEISIVLEHAREGVSVGGPSANGLLAITLLEDGRVEEAGRAIDDAAVEERWLGTAPYVYFLEARGRLRLATGDTAGALEDFRGAGAILGALNANNPSLVPWRSLAATAAARLGDAAEAHRLADEELKLARAVGAPRALGIAMRARALIQPGAEQAIEQLTEAVSVLERSPAQLEQARALTDLGAAMRRANRRADARAPLRTALELAHRSGAGALRARAAEELAATGARVGRAPRTGREALTPSERRVAGMAVEGMTNKEIAQALFVTVKAVEWHLSNAYRKLGIRSRGELTSALSAEEP